MRIAPHHFLQGGNKIPEFRLSRILIDKDYLQLFADAVDVLGNKLCALCFSDSRRSKQKEAGQRLRRYSVQAKHRRAYSARHPIKRFVLTKKILLKIPPQTAQVT